MHIYKIASILLLLFSLGAFTTKPLLYAVKGKDRRIPALKKEAFRELDRLSERLSGTARQIWEFAEIAMEEYKSSQLLAKLLEEHGFKVEFGVGGLPVAFLATYGQGRPVIGILGEYDALPGLSQQRSSVTQEPITPGAPGHGCGHNLFGAAGAGTAIAVKTIMQRHNLEGTIKFFGCPAEETVEGKTYMAREGIFSGLDICLDWHPDSKNEVSLETSNALNNFEVIFHGKTSHAAGDPWNGRSALDAVELMNHGVNCLREHVPTTARMHYVIPEAGKAPNIVPDYARVLKIAQGAALMTETTHEVHVITGVYNYLKNRLTASVLHRNLRLVGSPSFTAEEQDFARRLQRGLLSP
jgi:aminobenzoyl-glutamate utilization protein B